MMLKQLLTLSVAGILVSCGGGGGETSNNNDDGGGTPATDIKSCNESSKCVVINEQIFNLGAEYDGAHISKIDKWCDPLELKNCGKTEEMVTRLELDVTDDGKPVNKDTLPYKIKTIEVVDGTARTLLMEHKLGVSSTPYDTEVMINHLYMQTYFGNGKYADNQTIDLIGIIQDPEAKENYFYVNGTGRVTKIKGKPVKVSGSVTDNDFGDVSYNGQCFIDYGALFKCLYIFKYQENYLLRRADNNRYNEDCLKQAGADLSSCGKTTIENGLVGFSGDLYSIKQKWTYVANYIASPVRYHNTATTNYVGQVDLGLPWVATIWLAEYNHYRPLRGVYKEKELQGLTDQEIDKQNFKILDQAINFTQ